MKKTIQELVIYITQSLISHLGETESEQAAWWIVQEITNKTKTALLLDPTLVITELQHQKIDSWLKKMTKDHMPLAYLLGTIPFATIVLDVEPPLLIPRPETEEWVMHLIAKLQRLTTPTLSILEIGTGTGCIALALAKHLPHAHITALDINPLAITVAQRNAHKNNIPNVTFVLSDLFENIDQSFDLIVSNPPYISFDELPYLDLAVTKWEDPAALCADNEGLAIIQKIICLAPSYLHTNKELVNKGFANVIIEIGYKQADKVVQLMQNAGYATITVERDYAGNDRVVGGNVVPCGKNKKMTS